MKHISSVTFPALCLALLSAAGLAHAAPSDPDPTYVNTLGERRINFGADDQAFDVLAQSNGKILAAGTTTVLNSLTKSNFAAVRTNSNGSYDTTFGSGGVVTIDFGGTNYSLDKCYAAAVQSDGKTVLVGSTDNDNTVGGDMAVVRLNLNGTLDTTFSGNGKATIDFGNAGEAATGVAVLADGSIIVGGYSNLNPTSGSEHDFAVAKLTGAGVLDTTFSGDGKATANFGKQDQATSLAIQSDGKIVLAGFTADGSGASNASSFAVARFTTTGGLDTTFSGDGRATVDFGASDGEQASCVAIQSDGKIVLAGSKLTSAILEYDVALARLTTAGALDTTFGVSGKETLDWGANTESINAIAMQGTKIVLAGYTYIPDGRQGAVVARLNSNGTYDSTFTGSSAGRVTYAGTDGEAYNAVDIQADGKIVLAGLAGFYNTADFVISRRLGASVAAGSATTPSGGAS